MDFGVGIELEQTNLKSVILALQAFCDHYCLPKEFRGCGFDPRSISWAGGEDVHQLIASLEHLSEIQRRVLLEMTGLERSRSMQVPATGNHPASVARIRNATMPAELEHDDTPCCP